MTFPLNPADLYHTGVVVADLDAAMRRLSDVAGYRWTTPLTQMLPIRVPPATIEVELTLIYSLQSPHVELIAEVPDTPWTAAAHSAIPISATSLMSWSQQRAASNRRASGWKHAPISEGPVSLFAYYIDDLGTRIEIVDRAVIGDWPTFLRSLSQARSDTATEGS